MNSNKGAVIVETRQVKDFGLIVKNHLHFLPPHYGLTVFHANKNTNFVQNELNFFSGSKQATPTPIKASPNIYHRT
jgi:hypothetical protein